jgi:hypothetical protein
MKAEECFYLLKAFLVFSCLHSSAISAHAHPANTPQLRLWKCALCYLCLMPWFFKAVAEALLMAGE